jgi:hypothetical protein
LGVSLGKCEVQQSHNKEGLQHRTGPPVGRPPL